MVCGNCKKIISDNSMYCMYCHTPTVRSEDINVNTDILEDDLLLGAFARQGERAVHEVSIKENEDSPKKKKTIIVSLVSFICCAGVVIFCTTYLNSSSSIITKAEKLYEGGDYVASYELFEKALDREPENVQALIGAANSRIGAGDYGKGEEYLKKALDIDVENDKAYEALLETYTVTDQPEKLAEAKKYASTDKMQEIFNIMAIELPVFSEAGGKFEDDVTLSLSSKSDFPIYYTLTGKDPTGGSGILFKDDIVLTEGTTVVRAACLKNGTFGPVTHAEYIVEYTKPDVPIADLPTGDYKEPSKITLTTKVEGGKIYYTWDGSTPTEQSAIYTEPLDMPEGESVLSFCVINSHKKSSEIVRKKYNLITKESTEDVEEETEEKEPLDSDEEAVDSEISSGVQGSGNHTEEALSEEIVQENIINENV